MLQSHYAGGSSSCEKTSVTMQATVAGKLQEKNAHSLFLKDFQLSGGEVGRWDERQCSSPGRGTWNKNSSECWI